MRKKGPPAKYPLTRLDPPVTFYYGQEIDRQTASGLGRARYFTGEPCIWGHVAERWVASGTCVECVMRRHRTAEYRQYATPYLATYAEQNPDRVSDYNAQRRAKAEANPVKSEARREGVKRHWVERRKMRSVA